MRVSVTRAMSVDDSCRAFDDAFSFCIFEHPSSAPLKLAKGCAIRRSKDESMNHHVLRDRTHKNPCDLSSCSFGSLTGANLTGRRLARKGDNFASAAIKSYESPTAARLMRSYANRPAFAGTKGRSGIIGHSKSRLLVSTAPLTGAVCFLGGARRFR